MKKLNFALLVLLVASIGFTSCKKDEKKDPDPNGNNPTQTDLEWKGQLTLPVNPAMQFLVPAVDNQDNIYVLQDALGGLLLGGGYAIDAFDKNGNKLWSAESEGVDPINSQPVWYNNRLYFMVQDWDSGYLVCYNANSGSKEWQVELGVLVSKNLTISNGMAVLLSKKEFGSHWILESYDLQNGELVAAYWEEDGIPVFSYEHTRLVANGNTVFVCDDEKLFSFQVGSSSFEQNWNALLPADNEPENNFLVRKEMIVSPNGNIVLHYATDPYDLNSLAIASFNQSGDLLWQSSPSQDISHRMIADSGNHIYQGGSSLWKLNGSNGQVAWSVDGPDELFGMSSLPAPVMGKNGTIYTSDFMGIYLVDNSGSIKDYFLAGDVSDSFAIGQVVLLSNGNMVFTVMGEDRGQIFCLEGNSGGVASGWSKSGANRANTFNLAF